MNEELKIVISAETEKLQKELDKAQKEVEELKDKGKASFGEFNDSVQKVGNVAKGALKAAGVAIAGAATALLALTASTSEYRQEQAKLNAAFESVGGSAETAKQTYNDLFRVLGDTGTATEAAQQLANITTNEKDLAEYTTICQGVYAKWGAAIDTAGLAEGINHTVELGEVQGTLADALEWSGVSVDSFNDKLAKCNTESEREKLIRETLGGMYNEAAANYEESAAEILAQNEAQEKLNQSTAKLGEALAPINTMLTELGAEILADLSPYITDFAEKYMPDIKKALEGVGEAIGKVIQWIADNWELVSTLAVIILGIAAAVTVFSTAMAVVNAVMMASPVTWIVLAIVAAIAALVTIIVLVIKYWDEIKEAIKKCWDAICNAVEVAIDWVVNLFKSIIDWVKENWQGLLLLLVNPFAGAFKLIYDNCEGFRKIVDDVCKAIKGFFVDLWTGIKNTFKGVGNWFRDTFNSAVKAIKNVFSSIGDFFSGIWQKIKDIFSKVGSTIGDAVSGAFKSAINWVLNKAIGIINGFIKTINGAIGIINKIPAVNIPKLKMLDVPQLAQGGVVDKATLAMIGERGKEAVVPLENNTEWIDKIAAKLSAGMGGNQPIVMQVDGKTFAEISVKSLNDLTRLKGSLPLVYNY